MNASPTRTRDEVIGLVLELPEKDHRKQVSCTNPSSLLIRKSYLII